MALPRKASALDDLNEGLRVLTLHRQLIDKCEVLGQGALRLREEPDRLNMEKHDLEERLAEQENIAQEERRRAATLETTAAERATYAQLAQAQEVAAQQERHAKQLESELGRTKQDLQTARQRISDLQRTLAAEKRELEKLRQERWVTQPPRDLAEKPHAYSPRQIEHPELKPPSRPPSQPPSRPPSRPPSARGSAGASPRCGGSTPRPPMDTPMDSSRCRGACGAVGGSDVGWAAGMVVPADAPDLSAPFAEFAAVYGGLPRRAAPTAVTAEGIEGSRWAAHGHSAHVSTQTQQTMADATDGSVWEQRARELKQANSRLQMALVAAALDPDVDRSVIAAVQDASAAPGYGRGGTGGGGGAGGGGGGRSMPRPFSATKPRSARGSVTAAAAVVRPASARPASASSPRSFVVGKQLPGGLQLPLRGGMQEWPPMT